VRLTVSLLLIVAFATTARGLLPSTQIEVDQELHHTLELLRRSNPRRAEFYEHVLKLKEQAAARTPAGVVEQAALYSSRADDSWKAKEFKVLSYVTWQLYGSKRGMDQYSVVMSLLPHLQSDDARLRAFVEIYLDIGTPVEEEDLHSAVVQACIAFLHDHRADPPWPVAQALYWRAPSTALIQLTGIWSDGDVEELRTIQWSEHIINDAAWTAERFPDRLKMGAAAAELAKLSESKDWWVRLYAAEMLRRYKVFRNEQILQRLRKDPVALVAQAADVPYHGGKTADE
jgi:hypothetical protein